MNNGQHGTTTEEIASSLQPAQDKAQRWAQEQASLVRHPNVRYALADGREEDLERAKVLVEAAIASAEESGLLRSPLSGKDEAPNPHDWRRHVETYAKLYVVDPKLTSQRLPVPLHSSTSLEVEGTGDLLSAMTLASDYAETLVNLTNTTLRQSRRLLVTLDQALTKPSSEIYEALLIHAPRLTR